MTLDPLRKAAGNAAGRFFTTTACIACGSCAVLAPGVFREETSGHFIVARQPRDPKELAAVLEAYQITFAPNGPGPCIVDALDPANTPVELRDR